MTPDESKLSRYWWQVHLPTDCATCYYIRMAIVLGIGFTLGAFIL